MTTPRRRMIFDLTEADADRLERLRVARGMRSQAEALRWLIRRENAEAEAFIAERAQSLSAGARGVRRAASPVVQPMTALGEPVPRRGAVPKGAKRS